MPKEFDECVRRVENDPDLKPRKGQSKRDAAYAICVAQYKKRHGKSPLGTAEQDINELIKTDPDFRLAYLLLEYQEE